ncbi:DDB1- and CUL4-associated factor 8 isoform X2 [Monomorium pharaonis]|uniref:DDB1- and CUL4-associated factor 8 isoform X2 n=1 Tax=Monomorium pharaonis TaxID=307658 RepID=UPI00063F37C6|nr:DDB1- and CUL4-associated factor 8 isoform X2 [Monomorium pharaonis]
MQKEQLDSVITNPGKTADKKLNEEIPNKCLRREKQLSKWHIVPNIINRQIDSSLFQRKYYDSLNAVKRLKLWNFIDEESLITSLNFNERGNLLASVYGTKISIWNWAVEKRSHLCDITRFVDSDFYSNLSTIYTVKNTKWLPLDMESLMIASYNNGEIWLINLETKQWTFLGPERDVSQEHEISTAFSVHSETPYMILVGNKNGQVFSMDIRNGAIRELLTVKEDLIGMHLLNIDLNPYNSNEFCITGFSRYVRVYDRRNVSMPLLKLCPNSMTNQYITFVYAMYNYNGTEILTLIDMENIYLFDKLTSSNCEAHKYQDSSITTFVPQVKFFGSKSEYVMCISQCGGIFIWDKNTKVLVKRMTGNRHNRLEVHPHLPVFVTAEKGICIWHP